MPLQIEDASEALRQGIRACREGNWREGLTILSQLAQAEERGGRLPSFFYGYLGQAIARCEGRKRVGLELCQKAMELDPWRPENYVNLAALYMMIGNRRAAVRAIQQGLALDGDHRELTELQATIGARRQPVLRFLSRDNVINYWLGRMTWWMKLRREEQDLRRAEELEERRLDRI